MLDFWSVYNVAFYFGSIILTAALLFLAWKSTYVPGQQNITVVVWQHPSGRQTLQGFGASSGNNNLEHHNEQYEQIAFGSTGVEDISEVDSDEDLSIGRIINIVQEAVQATSVALQDAQESNILPSPVPLSDTGNLNTSQERPPVMEPTPTTQLGHTQRVDSSSNSLQASSQSAITSLSDSTHTQSVRPKSSTALNESDVDNSDSTLKDLPPINFPGGSSVAPSEALDAACTPSGSSSEKDSNPHSFSKVMTYGSGVAAICSSSTMSEVVQGNSSTLKEAPDNIDAIVTSTCRNSDVSQDSPTVDEASKPLLEKFIISSSTEHEDEFLRGIASVDEVPSTNSKSVAGKTSCPAPDSDHIEGTIRVRLKFLDDQQKTVQGILTQNVLCFKRNHFETELSEHRIVRLIFNGRLLKQDDSTLSEYGLYDNCVVHCHVSLPKPPPAVLPPATGLPNPAAARQGGATRRLLHMFRNVAAPDALDTDDPAEEGLNISNYLSGLLWLVVAGLWVARLKHSHMFSSFSTFMLVFLTLLLVVPHYLFAVDVQLDLSLDTRTLRNLGIERVVVLQRRQADGEQQPSLQETGQHRQGGSNVQHVEASAPQPTIQSSSGTSPLQETNVAYGTVSTESEAESASTVTPSESSTDYSGDIVTGGAVASEAIEDRPQVSPLEVGGGARRRHVV